MSLSLSREMYSTHTHQYTLYIYSSSQRVFIYIHRRFKPLLKPLFTKIFLTGAFSSKRLVISLSLSLSSATRTNDIPSFRNVTSKLTLTSFLKHNHGPRKSNCFKRLISPRWPRCCWMTIPNPQPTGQTYNSVDCGFLFCWTLVKLS